MFRMYVTSKIKHRILPFLLSMALDQNKTKRCLDHLEEHVRANQRSKVHGGIVLLVRKGIMVQRYNIAYTEDTLILKESLEAKGVIPHEV